jgi:hypothetical protein
MIPEGVREKEEWRRAFSCVVAVVPREAFGHWGTV